MIAGESYLHTDRDNITQKIDDTQDYTPHQTGQIEINQLSVMQQTEGAASRHQSEQNFIQEVNVIDADNKSLRSAVNLKEPAKSNNMSSAGTSNLENVQFKQYDLKTDWGNIPYEKESVGFMNDSIAIQKRKLVEEALNFGLKLKAIDEDFDAPGVKSKKLEKRLSM